MNSLLQEEIDEKEASIKEIEGKYKSALEEINSLRSEYNRSEIQIVSHQYNLETLKKTLKSHESVKRELENLNDHWEQSVRSLEYYNSSLENQFNAAQEEILGLDIQLKEISSRTEEEYKSIQLKCEEIKKELTQKTIRAPSPGLKAPKHPSLIITKPQIVSIDKKISLENTAKVVIVSSKNMYANENTVQILEKNGKFTFEFNRVVKKEEMANEIVEAVERITQGGNACIVNNSVNEREKTISMILMKSASLLQNKKAEFSVFEIIGEEARNLLNEEHSEIVLNEGILDVFLASIKNLSRGKSHILITITVNNSVYQILDIGEVNEDQSLSESLSINSSIFYLEELMMNLSKGKNVIFNKSMITRKLEPSLSGKYFILFLLHCENGSNLSTLTFGARMQQMFLTKNYNNKEIDRTLNLLEKERTSNLGIMRLIEKVRKDLNVLKKVADEKDKKYESLLKTSKIRTSGSQNVIRITSLSPKYVRPECPSRIPLPDFHKIH